MGVITPIPSPDSIARAERLTREHFVYEGEKLEDALAPGSARRRALDAALAELDAGNTQPSLEWRRQFSLLLGLERLLSEEEPHLADGTVLSAHQVDALSGTLTALLAEAQRSANGNANGSSNGATAEREPAALASAAIPGAENGELDLDEPEDEDEEPQDWQYEDDEGALRRAARGSQRRPPVLVRARDRSRQDGRRARLRRGLAHRRGADPDPPAQPRRPVQRRAPRPWLSQPNLRAAGRRPRRGQRPGDGRDISVVRPQRRAGSPTPTRS